MVFDGEPTAAPVLADLNLGEEWERSFRNFVDQQPELVASTIELEDLLDLHDAGLPVAWPRGLDPRVARTILRNRRAIPDG